MTEDNLILQPANELIFNGPFRNLVTNKLSVKNRLAHVVVYRLVASSKAIYCAEHTGLLQPRETRILSICLSPDQHVHDYALEVQSFFLPRKDVNLLEFWNEANPLMISRQRVACVLRTEPDDDVPLGLRLRRILTSYPIDMVKRFNCVEDPQEDSSPQSIVVLMFILIYIMFAFLVWKLQIVRVTLSTGETTP